MQSRRPDWWSYLCHSIALERYGDKAIEWLQMPVESELWRAGMLRAAVVREQFALRALYDPEGIPYAARPSL